MIKNFNSSVVLTAANPEAILTFTFEPGDNPGSFTPILNDYDFNKVLINGMNFSKTNSNVIKMINFNKDVSIAAFHIMSNSNEDFDINIQLKFTGLGAGGSQIYDVSVYNRKYVNSNLSEFNSYATLNQQIEDKSSFMLLRTNPKFSGNIKLVVDSNDNLYLDTIKVNTVLSKKEYRKRQVSPKGEYANDIRNVFGNLPLGILHQVGEGDNNYDISLPKTTLDRQYSYTYSYGARLLTDDLYNESYSIFAPLWINDILPDYFVVFKLPGTYNEETYDKQDLLNITSKYLSKSSIVKTWNMKDNSQIGEYLRKHIKNNSSITSPLFISFNDFDDNIFNGISVNSGVIASVAEPPYFFNRVKNFTALNEFISNGFERNNLVMSNLINLEFIFDDNNAEEFSMNRYFGLYLTQNELYNIYYYKENKDSSLNILNLNNKDINVFLSSNIVFDISTGLLKPPFENRLFFNNTNEKIDKVTTIKQVDGKSSDFNVNRIGENIFSTHLDKIDITTPFITFSLENKLNSGEHLRVIDIDNYVIYEVYGVNDNNLLAGESWSYATSINTDTITIYRTCFSVKGDIKDQILAISKAFNILREVNDSVLGDINHNENSIGIILNKYLSVAYFQRITSQTETQRMSGEFNNSASLEDIKIFGRIHPKNFNIIDETDVFTYYNFEHFGRRNSFRYTFFNNRNANLNKYFWSCDQSIKDSFRNNMLYQGEDLWYRLMTPFKLTTDVTVSYIQDPYNLNNIMVHSLSPINLINGLWHAYSILPSSIHLMGINAVKDFDFNIYDYEYTGLNSQYFYNREDDASCNSLSINKNSSYTLTNRDSYIVISGEGNLTLNNTNVKIPYTTNTQFNTYFGSVLVEPTSNTIIKQNILESDKNLYQYGYKNENEEFISDYKNNNSSKKLKIPIVTPCVTKWNGMGNDCRNNPIRLWVNPTKFTQNVKSSFLPYNNDAGIFTDEISYPVYKYMSPQEHAWKSYVYYDINDVIKYKVKTEDGYKDKYDTIKNLMFILPNVDFFSKLVYSTHDKSEFFNKSSILYYNKTKNALDVFINGINISLSVDEGSRSIVNLQNYNKYNFSFISTSSRSTSSNSPLEIIINENTKTVLLIWYQGADILDYSRRNNNIVAGKSILSNETSLLSRHTITGFDKQQYSLIKTPYNVNTANILLKTNIIYDNINNSYYPAELTNRYLQYNNNFAYNYHSVLNAYTNKNTVVNNIFNYNNAQYNTLDGSISYNISNNPLSYNLNNTVNYGYVYNSNLNNYTKNKHNVCNLTILKKLLMVNTVYTISGNDHKVNFNKNFSPINITINEPRDYKNYNYDTSLKVYSGWYKPTFNNIFNFSINEDSSIIYLVESDFTLSNTNLVSHNNIKQMWQNIVTKSENINEKSFSDNNFAIKVKKDFNPFSCIWDANYYNINDSYTNSININGYESPYEIPSYFGSKLVKLPKELLFNKWEDNNVTIVEDKSNNKIDISFLITRKIKDYFSSNIKFTKNWVLPNISNTSNIIEQYINNTIIPYYSLYNDTINIEVYTKKYDGKLLYLENDGSFDNKIDNFKGSLELNMYNEYIYTIQTDTVNNLPLYSYFVKFIIKEK